MRELRPDMRELRPEETESVSGGTEVCVMGHCFDFQPIPPEEHTLTPIIVVDVPLVIRP